MYSSVRHNVVHIFFFCHLRPITIPVYDFNHALNREINWREFGNNSRATAGVVISAQATSISGDSTVSASLLIYTERRVVKKVGMYACSSIKLFLSVLRKENLAPLHSGGTEG